MCQNVSFFNFSKGCKKLHILKPHNFEVVICFILINCRLMCNSKYCLMNIFALCGTFPKALNHNPACSFFKSPLTCKELFIRKNWKLFLLQECSILCNDFSSDDCACAFLIFPSSIQTLPFSPLC